MAIHRRLFLFLLILLPTQLGFHFWPAWAYLLGRKVDYLSPTVFVTDLVLFAMLIAWWVPAVGKKSHHRALRVSWRQAIIVLGVLGAVTANVLVSANQEVAIYKWVKLLEFAGLGWYIVRTQPVIHEMIFALSLGILYSSVLAIIQFILQHSAGGIFWFFGERTFTPDTPGISRFNICWPFISTCKLALRPYATFPHPNVLGGFLATSLPFIVYKQMTEFGTKNTSRYYYWLVLLFGYAALVLTLSRSAWSIAAAIVIGMLYILVRGARSRLLNNTVSFRIFLTTLSAFVVGLLVMVILFQPSMFDESVIRRMTLNHVALSLWQQSPVIGIGLGNFLVALPKSVAGRQINFLQPAHNIYLLLLSESGLLGLSLFVAGLWITLKRRMPLIHTHPLSLTHVFFLSFCGLLVAGFVDHYPITLQQSQVWFVVLFAYVFTSKLR